MDEPTDRPPAPKRQPRNRGNAKKPHGNSKRQRPKEKAPFKYDAMPVLALHIGPGRPTDYKPFRGDELIGHMAGGFCFTAAAAAMGFNPDTLYEWARRHPEFADAKKRGQACLTLYYNRKLNSSIDGASVTASIFGLKNSSPKEWRDKHEIEQKTAEDDPLLAYLRSINGRVLRPAEPVTIEAEAENVASLASPAPPQIEGPPRPISPGAAQS
jgi:transposase-like protein